MSLWQCLCISFARMSLDSVFFYEILPGNLIVKLRRSNQLRVVKAHAFIVYSASNLEIWLFFHYSDAVEVFVI